MNRYRATAVLVLCTLTMLPAAASSTRGLRGVPWRQSTHPKRVRFSLLLAPCAQGFIGNDSFQCLVSDPCAERRWWLGAGVRMEKVTADTITLGSGAQAQTMVPYVSCAFERRISRSKALVAEFAVGERSGTSYDGDVESGNVFGGSVGFLFGEEDSSIRLAMGASAFTPVVVREDSGSATSIPVAAVHAGAVWQF